MSHDIAQHASALIEQIQTRYHESHRRALPPLLVLASAVEARGMADGLVEDLAALGDALELHMFKEEMRLFPMMEQGGNTLIEQLIDDLHAEHVEHDHSMAKLRTRLTGLVSLHAADPALRALDQAVAGLSDELAHHISIEDDELFPMFRRPRSTPANHEEL